MFRNIVLPRQESVNVLEQNATRKVADSGYFKNIEVGAGAKTFKMDERGQWMGASDFSDAPFRIDMQGNFYLYASDSSGGYIKISADLQQIIVNDGTNDRILIGRQEGGL
jgi:hypothetical protein